jgi:trk system potassium uptake protein TrkH
MTVVLIWLGASTIGSFPYFFSGTLNSPVDAFFESVSGFTTTGNTILCAKQYNTQSHEEIAYVKKSSDNHSFIFYGNVKPLYLTSGEIKEGIEALPRALLLWRSMTQWLGGGGIVVLFLTLLPLAGVGNKVLFQSEVTGPSKEGLTPRIKETARILWKIYLGLSLALLFSITFWIPELSWFESLTLMLSTVSTGGFSIYNTNMAHFQNETLELILSLFMILGSINFYLLFHLIKGQFYKAFDIELLLFLVIILSITLSGAWILQGENLQSLSGEALKSDSIVNLKTSFFHLASLTSSTGYASVNFAIWPASLQFLLFVSMYIGGMSGSTAGGIKVIRIYILIRYCFYRIKSLLQPESVETFKLHGREIESTTVTLVFSFFGLVLIANVTGAFIYLLDGLDMGSALSLTACNLNNSGQGFNMIGPTESCAFLSSSSKLLSCFQMLLGRLEYFTLLMVMIPAFYRK